MELLEFKPNSGIILLLDKFLSFNSNFLLKIKKEFPENAKWCESLVKIKNIQIGDCFLFSEKNVFLINCVVKEFWWETMKKENFFTIKNKLEEIIQKQSIKELYFIEEEFNYNKNIKLFLKENFKIKINYK
jgi:hypothetical protein